MSGLTDDERAEVQRAAREQLAAMPPPPPEVAEEVTRLLAGGAPPTPPRAVSGHLTARELAALAVSLSPDQLRAAMLTVVRVSPGLARNAIDAAIAAHPYDGREASS